MPWRRSQIGRWPEAPANQKSDLIAVMSRSALTTCAGGICRRLDRSSACQRVRPHRCRPCSFQRGARLLYIAEPVPRDGDEREQADQDAQPYNQLQRHAAGRPIDARPPRPARPGQVRPDRQHVSHHAHARGSRQSEERGRCVGQQQRHHKDQDADARGGHRVGHHVELDAAGELGHQSGRAERGPAASACLQPLPYQTLTKGDRDGRE
mmetsp:Transcript_12213/g.40128  ORF Transcript_12213/g.40128 Transcript_12213/m.40128 type:complete len:209 (-) Transcript_12213:508-1134(-)